MNKKKIISMLMALIMVTGLLAACSNNNNGNAQNEPSPTASNSGNNSAGEYPDYSQGFPESVDIEIPVYERAFEGWSVSDNYYTQWIQKEFGDKYNVKVKFVPITRNAEVTEYQQLLAAGNGPDIIFHYDMPQAMAYYGQNVMQPLDWNEIAHYAPTYSSKMSDTNQKYGVVEEKNMFFFASRPDYSNFVGLIRKDWVEKIGMKVEDITSLEKYNEVLQKWKEAGLGVGGAGLTANIYNYSYAYRDWPVDQNEHALYSDLSIADFTTPATEAWLSNLSYQFNNGLIDQEFYLRDAASMKAQFVGGRTGTYGEYMASNTDLFAATIKNNPEAEFDVLPPGAGIPEGSEAPIRANWPFGLIMGINQDSSAEERTAVWMYLEWMSQPDNLFFLQNGVEGQNYTLDADGIPMKNEDYTGETVLSNNNNKDYWSLVTEAPDYGSPEKTLAALKKFWTPVGYEEIINDMLTYAEESKKYAIADPLFTVPLEKVNEYKADLNSLFQELYLKIALAPEDQFDGLYQEAKTKFLEGGYQEILDEKQKAIDAGQVK